MVYEVVDLIPAGKVTSYGAIAKYLSSARAARMVGWAMNNSHHSRPDLPAHRVVNRSGYLSGREFFGPGEEMADMLRKEGLTIIDSQIKDFQDHFWDPNTELVV